MNRTEGQTMKKHKQGIIINMPEKYLERQRVMKALKRDDGELFLWDYDATNISDTVYIWAVYLDKDDNYLMFKYDKDTLKPICKCNMNTYHGIISLLAWARRGETTDLFGYAIGVTMRPPKPEGKIIQFPKQEENAV
jgi:hypothetical protein